MSLGFLLRSLIDLNIEIGSQELPNNLLRKNNYVLALTHYTFSLILIPRRK